MYLLCFLFIHVFGILLSAYIFSGYIYLASILILALRIIILYMLLLLYFLVSRDTILLMFGFFISESLFEYRLTEKRKAYILLKKINELISYETPKKYVIWKIFESIFLNFFFFYLPILIVGFSTAYFAGIRLNDIVTAYITMFGVPIESGLILTIYDLVGGILILIFGITFAESGYLLLLERVTFEVVNDNIMIQLSLDETKKYYVSIKLLPFSYDRLCGLSDIINAYDRYLWLGMIEILIYIALMAPAFFILKRVVILAIILSVILFTTIILRYFYYFAKLPILRAIKNTQKAMLNKIENFRDQICKTYLSMTERMLKEIKKYEKETLDEVGINAINRIYKIKMYLSDQLKKLDEFTKYLIEDMGSKDTLRKWFSKILATISPILVIAVINLVSYILMGYYLIP